MTRDLQAQNIVKPINHLYLVYFPTYSSLDFLLRGLSLLVVPSSIAFSHVLSPSPCMQRALMCVHSNLHTSLIVWLRFQQQGPASVVITWWKASEVHPSRREDPTVFWGSVVMLHLCEVC